MTLFYCKCKIQGSDETLWLMKSDIWWVDHGLGHVRKFDSLEDALDALEKKMAVRPKSSAPAEFEIVDHRDDVHFVCSSLSPKEAV